MGLVVELGDGSPDTKPWCRVEYHADIVRGDAIQYFPGMDDGVSLTPSLQRQDLEFFQSLPVVTSYSSHKFSE